MSASQRRKGADGERELVNLLRDRLGDLPGLCRNLEQSRSGGADILLPGYAIEVKRAERFLSAWIEQAEREAGRIQAEANQARSEKAKAQSANKPRDESGQFQPGEHTTCVLTKPSTNAGAKSAAAATGTNRGDVPVVAWRRNGGRWRCLLVLDVDQFASVVREAITGNDATEAESWRLRK